MTDILTEALLAAARAHRALGYPGAGALEAEIERLTGPQGYEASRLEAEASNRAAATPEAIAAFRARQGRIEAHAHDYMDTAGYDRNSALAALQIDLDAAHTKIAELEMVAGWIGGMDDLGYHGPDRREE